MKTGQTPTLTDFIATFQLWDFYLARKYCSDICSLLKTLSGLIMVSSHSSHLTTYIL